MRILQLSLFSVTVSTSFYAPAGFLSYPSPTLPYLLHFSKTSWKSLAISDETPIGNTVNPTGFKDSIYVPRPEKFFYPIEHHAFIHISSSRIVQETPAGNPLVSSILFTFSDERTFFTMLLSTCPRFQLPKGLQPATL